MIRLLMAQKYWRSDVHSCREQVPVDNWNLCRLDYRVAEATTVFYAKRIHTGGSFPPNVRASSLLVSPRALPTDWLGRNLSRLMQRFSAIRHCNMANLVLSI